MSASAVIVSGVPPWDGRYEFDDFSLTNEELYRVKVVSRGIRAGELLEALAVNDTAAFVGFAVAIMERHGKKPDPDEFWRAPVGSIGIEIGDVADPPTMEDSGGGSSESDSSSGGGSGEGGV